MRRRSVVAVALAAVVIVAGAAIGWWLLTRPAGPDETAEAFLDALAAGDGDRALALAEAPPDAGSDPVAAFEGAAEFVSEPELQSVGSAETGGTRATVTFRLAGQERSATFGLVERGGAWLVGADAFGILSAVTDVGDSVLAGGVVAPASTAVALLPAVYPVEASPAGILTGATSATLLPGERSEAIVDASLSPEAATLAQEQIDAYAQRCAQPSAAVPANCGVKVPWAADLAALTSIAFRIEQTPAVALSADLSTFAATGGAIVATATGPTRDGATASFTYRADDWALRGVVVLDADGMQLAVQ